MASSQYTVEISWLRKILLPIITTHSLGEKETEHFIIYVNENKISFKLRKINLSDMAQQIMPIEYSGWADICK